MPKNSKTDAAKERSSKDPSELADAAALLDAELRRYEDLAQEARKIPLSSEKNLNRAARAMKDAADCQERVGGHLRTLVGAINVARERQQANMELLLARAQEVQKHADHLQELMKRFASLGDEAREINSLMQRALAEKTEAGDPDRVVERLREVHARMEVVVKNAAALAKDADERGFEDIARQADSLGQQITAAKNKLNLLEQGLHALRPS